MSYRKRFDKLGMTFKTNVGKIISYIRFLIRESEGFEYKTTFTFKQVSQLMIGIGKMKSAI